MRMRVEPISTSATLALLLLASVQNLTSSSAAGARPEHFQSVRQWRCGAPARARPPEELLQCKQGVTAPREGRHHLRGDPTPKTLAPAPTTEPVISSVLMALGVVADERAKELHPGLHRPARRPHLHGASCS